jgi:hypothetical protein
MKPQSIASAILVGLLAAGCADEPPDEVYGDTTTNALRAPTTKEMASSKKHEAPKTGDLTGSSGAQSAFGAPCNGGDCDKTAECTSTADGNKSDAKLVYSPTGQIKSLTVVAINAAHRDGNDVAVLAKAPGGGDYVFGFRSDAILTDGATVSVPLPNGFSVEPGSSLRIDTRFSGANASETASCYMTL